MFAMSERQALSAEGTIWLLTKYVFIHVDRGSGSMGSKKPDGWKVANSQRCCQDSAMAERMVAAVRNWWSKQIHPNVLETQSLTALKAAMEKELAGLPPGRWYCSRYGI